MSLRKCRERHWRCEAKDASGKRRCLNHWDGHEKGHQFFRLNVPSHRKTNSVLHIMTGSSPSLTVGPFEHSFDSDNMIHSLVAEINRLRDAGYDAQVRALSQTARSSGVSTLFSNRTCLTCLVNCPLYTLPCPIQPQHAVCEPCAERFSIAPAHAGSYISLKQCPLDCNLTKSPWIIRKKPKNAGVRILSLDG